jgi:hypothetical protein
MQSVHKSVPTLSWNPDDLISSSCPGEALVIMVCFCGTDWQSVLRYFREERFERQANVQKGKGKCKKIWDKMIKSSEQSF